MALWIDHPAVDNPVSLGRWLKWKLSQRLLRLGERLESAALYPNCEDCGLPAHRGDHSRCDVIPF